jgi:adenylate cyclase
VELGFTVNKTSWNLRLRPSILTLFVLLTVPVFVTIVAVSYVANDRIARSHAGELVERFLRDGVQDMQRMFDPIKSLIRAAATIGQEQPDFYKDDRSHRYLFSILTHSNTIISAYVGLSDGSFRQARQIDPTVKVQEHLPPAGTKFAYRTVRVHEASLPVDRYTFLDERQNALGVSAQATTYDPRVRGWYTSTAQAGSLFVTEPDIFAALGLIGFTIAAAFHVDGKLLGIAAADITLDGLSHYLAEHRISPGTSSYIIDANGRVIANSEQVKAYSNEGGQLRLTHITSLESDLPVAAYAARPRGQEQLFSFTHSGQEYLASISSLPAEFGQRWQLFVITPLRDFTGEFDQHNLRLLLFGLAVITIQILVIYGLSSVVSAPLEKLALKVTDLHSLKEGERVSLHSPIREVAVLSRAIDTLDTAVRSFSAFVPVGLVKQLLETDRKLELGGQSRFLTIQFSDLEGFSSLSERVPSQELFLVISSYLELVTRSVNAESGTIDKFIGDGVMAFWGAPALLDDHAWRACVSAMRIQRGMDLLNERWTADGHSPLKVRIGIHSDAVLVGNIGSAERMSYTVLGDGVNLASRLEGINKEFGTRVTISQSVFKEAGERLCVRPISEVAIKGRRAKTPVYELMGVYGAGADLEPSPDALKLCDLTRLAYETLVDGDPAEALRRYHAVLSAYPGDPVASELAKRLSPAEAEGKGSPRT